MTTTERRACLAVLAVAIAVHLGAPGPAWRNAAYLTVTLGSTLLAWRGTLAHRDAPRAWRVVALGITLTLVGDLVYGASDFFLEDSPGEATLADPIWLAGYACLALAFVRLLVPPRHMAQRPLLDGDRLLDLAIVLVVATILVWEVVDLRSGGAAGELLDRVLLVAYPVADLLLLALAAIVLLTDGRRSRAVVDLVAGTSVWLIGDLVFVATAQNGFNAHLEELGWFTASWMAGLGLLALAVNRPDVVDTGRSVEPREQPVGAGRLALAMAPLAVPVLVAVWPREHHDGSFSITLAVGSTMLIFLAYLRALRLLRAREQARQELAARERYYRVLSTHSSDAVLVVDAEGRVRNMSPSITRLLGPAAAAVPGRSAGTLARALEPSVMRRWFGELLDDPEAVKEVELELDLPELGRRWLALRGVNLLDDPDIVGIVVHLHDVTARKQAEQELQVRAFHDPLTGLANRTLLLDRLDHALRRRSGPRHGSAVVFLDLDGFKAVNDSLGHDCGDQLLCVVADRLRDEVREEDTVARLGGDEFAILVEDRVEPLDEAAVVAERILTQLSQPVCVDGRELTVSASIGIAAGAAGATAVSLVRDADIAMYRAKAAGKGRWVAYEPGMHTAAVEQLQVETDLPVALEQGQFELRYQPVVDLVTGHTTAFEALLRWNHPTLGQIAPDRFIPVAEASGAIVPIGAWVLAEACRTAARWQRHARDGPRLQMAVNVSGRQLASPELVATVVDVLERTGLPAGDLVLEVTETSLVDDVNMAAERLTALHDLGVRLAIDDFGTGYSSLTYLRLFPVDVLKVDRSFIDAITEQGRTPAIVRGLLDLGRTLGLEIVAEGIEHLHQLDLLREEGCDLGQGYLFAHPLSAEDAEALVARGATASWPAAAVAPVG